MTADSGNAFSKCCATTLGIVGRVTVTTENRPILVGDLLVSSSTPGHAMKGTDRSRMLGAVVGKALEPLKKGTDVIQVLVAAIRSKKRQMSASARARIAKAQRARWAKVRAAKKNA